MRVNQTVTLVLGGVRSGKSRFAQELASENSPVTFIATARPVDDEMREKIRRHRMDRPAAWETLEVPIDLDLALKERGAVRGTLLVDCLTLFAANIMTVEKDNVAGMLERAERFCKALDQVNCSAVIVSNEVGSGIVPAFPSGRIFRDLLGEINQMVARHADNVLLMTAGLPLVLKGKVAAPRAGQ